MTTQPPFRRGKSNAERRREDLRRIDAMTVKVTKVYGRVLIIGAGEASVDIPLPVDFTEKPNFNFGGELDENHRPLAGYYPTISAVVVNWETLAPVEGVFEGYYVGATVAVVSSGQDDHNIWLHYSFEGKALRNPVQSTETTDDPI